MSRENRNPGFGFWNNDGNERDYDDFNGTTGRKSPRYRLIEIVECLNSIIVKDGNGNMDLKGTIETRKSFILCKKIPNNSTYYQEGYGIQTDENGMPYYGLLK
ncbi:MAG: hypothetical protein ABIH25_04175 [Candidatus Woesearchaeota archaeon]